MLKKSKSKSKSQDLSYLTVECECKNIKDVFSKDFVDKYTTGKAEYGCKSHKKKKFIKYCSDCKNDLCVECLKEKLKDNNASGIHSEQENLDLLDHMLLIETYVVLFEFLF